MSYSPDSKYYYFWSGVFSQWHSCHFKVEDEHFNSAEQYMMYRKALLFKDEETLNKIMLTDNSKEQKALGRLIKNYNDALWIEHREEVVYSGNYAKFSQNPKLLKKLLSTEPAILVESSPIDKVWGVGLHKTDPLILQEKNWQGLNLLGKILTTLRGDLLQFEEHQ